MSEDPDNNRKNPTEEELSHTEEPPKQENGDGANTKPDPAISKIREETKEMAPVEVFGRTLNGVVTLDEDTSAEVPGFDPTKEVKITDQPLYSDLLKALEKNPGRPDVDPDDEAIEFRGEHEHNGIKYKFAFQKEGTGIYLTIKNLKTNEKYNNEIYLDQEEKYIMLSGWTDDDVEPLNEDKIDQLKWVTFDFVINEIDKKATHDNIPDWKFMMS